MSTPPSSRSQKRWNGVPRWSVGYTRHSSSAFISWFIPTRNAAVNAGLVCSRIAVSGSSPSADGSIQPPPSASRARYVGLRQDREGHDPGERVDGLRRDDHRRRRAAPRSDAGRAARAAAGRVPRRRRRRTATGGGAPVDGSRHRGRHGRVELRRRRLIGDRDRRPDDRDATAAAPSAVRSTTLMTAGSSAGGKNGSVPVHRPVRHLPGLRHEAADGGRASCGRAARAAPARRRRLGIVAGRRDSRSRSRERRRSRRASAASARRAAAPSGPAVRAITLAPSCAARARRTARLTAGRCALASRRNAADVAPVGTLDVRESDAHARGRRVVEVGRRRQASPRGPAPRPAAAGRRAARRRGVARGGPGRRRRAAPARRGRWPHGSARPAATRRGRRPPGCAARPRRRARRRCGARRCG